MKKIAVIFSNTPYGNYIGLDGLKFALSASCYLKKISFFFINDGVFYIINNKNKNLIVSHSFYSYFKLLKLYNINNFYLCYDSLLKRGLHNHVDFVIKVNICSFLNIRYQINKFDIIFNF
ncbi:sulfurtransferase complex subunit TusC [Buchnera aphidicola]|uniref:Sulfurtransferase complex subunit TusC n=1 Tax=Buchnera aphidicola (Therioaphis trifolii) TaxID=1241884 RepID=A0A4D6YGH3_9GAMM|nr:sulfurtransferase complex subunit TusC [Buchnera aphidicola]QCI27343.1 sulfurtransferase complex subunit TusC [Buchnera aphidicola (Therioaphis trifolii)]